MLLGQFAGLFALNPQPSAAAPLSLRQWSTAFLTYLGAPARSPAQPRVQFVAQWAGVEGTFEKGNANNPLDTEMRAPGAKLFNAAGVKTYPSLREGFDATLATLNQGFDHPILTALRLQNATMSVLGLALAKSNWTGFGQTSWNEQMYASSVSGQPMSSFRLPQPTVSIRGVVVDPLGHRVARVCVTPVRGNLALAPVLTGANGTYDISHVARAPYRLEISDCRHVLNHAPTTLYDATALPRHVSPSRAEATVLSSSCTLDKPCLSQSVNVPHVITFGILTSSITWPRPTPITYGTRLSASQLDAKASAAGTLRYSIARGELLNPGVHTVTVTFRPRNASSFTLAHATQRIVVNRLPATLTWPQPMRIPVGTALSVSQLDAVASVPGTFTYSPPLGTVLGPGSHPITLRFQPADLAHYRAVTDQVVISTALATSSP